MTSYYVTINIVSTGAIIAKPQQFELIGAIAYMGIALLSYVLTGEREHWSVYILLSGSLFLVGVLFLAYWVSEKGKPKR